MNVLERIIDLERRMTRQEANRGASLRFGTVTESNAVGSARVQLHDGGDMVSHPVRTLQRRTLKDQDQCLPDVGEQVAVLFAGQGMEEGCVLGAVYSQKDASPARPVPQDYYRYEDGTELWYDREEHKLVAKVKGDMEAEVEGNITAKAKGNAELEAEGHIHAKAQKEIRAESATTITLKAPIIALNGLLRVTDKDGGPGSGDLYGNYRIRQGSLSVPDDNISTGQQLIAAVDASIGGIAFVPHQHGNVLSGPGVSGPPVGGGGGGTGGGIGGSDPNNTRGYEAYFRALFENTPSDASDKDTLLLCLPKIALAEAQASWLENDKEGWRHLQAMFHRWFTLPANADAEVSREVFWVSMEWVRSYLRAELEYQAFIPHRSLFSPKGCQRLEEILHRDGYFGQAMTRFDYTFPDISFGSRPWQQWKDNYFQSTIVNQLGTALADGLACSLGNFNFRALAAGYTEPLAAGGHKIVVEKVSVFVWDSFNFEGDDELGYWNCENTSFSRFLGDEEDRVYNSDFQNFRAKFNLGHDFMVLSPPQSVDGFERYEYAVKP